MWLQQLVRSIKARWELALWLKRQRAGRLDLSHLSDHMRADLGLDNPRTETSLHWQQAPEPAQKTADTSANTEKVRVK